MTQQVNFQKKSRPSEVIVPAALGAVGSYYGGPAAGQAASTAGGAVVNSQNQGGGGGVQLNDNSAAYRRMQQMPGNQMPSNEPSNNLKDLEDARFALAQQSPEMQQQYAPAIYAAMLKARREQGAV